MQKKTMVVPKGEEWREEEIWEGKDELQVLFFMQQHVLHLLDIYGEFGQAR